MIRDARPEDSDALAMLAGELGYPTTPAEMAGRFATLSPQDAVLVFDDAGVLGWIHISVIALLESDPFAEIRGLVVAAAARGKGIGSRLVTAAESWAVGRGCGRLRVRSNVVRGETRLFYERRGFVVTKTQNVFDKLLGDPSPALRAPSPRAAGRGSAERG